MGGESCTAVVRRAVAGRREQPSEPCSSPASGRWAADPHSAVHNLAFQLDTGAAGANTADDTAADPPIDWEDLFQGPGDISPKVTLPNAAFPGFTASGGRADYALPDFTTYATGSKDTLPISPGGSGGWQCSKSQNVGDKVDIVNSYATAYINPANNHLILYYGVESRDLRLQHRCLVPEGRHGRLRQHRRRRQELDWSSQGWRHPAGERVHQRWRNGQRERLPLER